MQVCVRAETMGVAVPRPRTVLDELHNQNLYWRAMLRRLPLSDIQKEKRLSFAQSSLSYRACLDRFCCFEVDGLRLSLKSDSLAQYQELPKRSTTA